MSGSRASSEVLSSPSPSPSPPPPHPLKNIPSTSKPKVASLDDTSSLSELTDDEGDGSRGASTHSSTPEEANGAARRKRGSLVPAPMWGWAYKSAVRKPTDNVKAASRQGSSTPPPPPSAILPAENGNDDMEIEQNVDSKESEHPPGLDDADKGGESDASTEGAPDAADQDDVEEEEEEEEEEELEEEQVDTDEEEPVSRVDGPSKGEEKTAEGSPDLTDVEDEDEALSERESESESEVESENEEDAEPAVAEEPADEPLHKVTVDSTAPVVPAAPASSSIMAGQQLIKTPTPSPSPEPEPRPTDDTHPQELEPEATTGLEREPEPDPDVDNTEDVEPAELDAYVEHDVGVETEEAETDVQPAHRAEALDVLAGIELKFALLREALYVEKMEDLAIEEAMILQGIHPEMIQLQAELQVRHDRRLELASGKRKHEDDHVKMMRRYEEDAIWGWWKHGRDKLQSEMFAEANRKRRKLDREKRVLERPPSTRRVPPPPPIFSTDAPLPTTRELFKYTSTSLRPHDQRHRRKHAQRSARPRMYPTLSVLSLSEVQSDLQQLPIRRQMGYGPQFGSEIGPGMGGPVPPALEPFSENALGIIPGQQAFGQGPPQFAPLPSSQQRPYPSPVNRPIPPQSHHQPIGAPPIGGLHHGGSRAMQGPGQPQVHSGSGGPPPFGNSRARRSPSPPPFDLNGINGSVPQHGGMSGPGQRGWSGAGPSKVNGWKEPRRIASNESKDVHQFDMRDMRAEREPRPEKRVRDHRDEWYENGVARDGQDHSRPHGPPAHHSSGAQTHRHTLQHQSLHGIPHHHHVVHRHPGSHHHHDLSRSGASGRRHEHPGAEYDHRLRRLPPDADHHANSRSNVSPLWKPEDSEPLRERPRPPLVGPSSSAMGSLPPPPSDRLQPTPFVMTPTQASLAMQGHPPQHNSRRDHWDDGRPPPFTDGHVPLSQEPGPSRHGHGHVPHSHRLPSPPRQNSRNGLASPRRIAPDISPPYQVQSPRHHPHSLHPSPRMGTSSLKSTRPISPVPAKILPSALYPPGPTGPGTPGVGSGSSRMGTPGLAGPGTRPDGPPHPNGHGPISLFPSPAPSLTGPGGQSHLPPGSQDLLPPPKMSVVPL